MYNIKTLNSISPKGLVRLAPEKFAIDVDGTSPDGILVRSAAMHDMEMPASLLAIGRAGAGTNNIPVDKCAQEGIVVFNTPGANANAVKELILGALIVCSRNVVPAAEWVKTLQGKGDEVPKLVEKGKNQFVGPELAGKKLGVIGLGAIGGKVANMAVHLGMEVLGYDPFISVQAAWNLSRSVKHCTQLSEIYSQCDYITLHLPVTAETKGFIGTQALAEMKAGVRILNFARGELVNTEAMLAAVADKRVACYITDFPNEALLNKENIVCIPHLGASTPESEDNCAVMAADQLREYLENGNIINSVNLPNLVQPRTADHRVCVIHKNEKGIISGITDLAAKDGLNIENMTSKSRGDMAYTVLDVAGSHAEDFGSAMEKVAGVIRVRIL